MSLANLIEVSLRQTGDAYYFRYKISEFLRIAKEIEGRLQAAKSYANTAYSMLGGAGVPESILIERINPKIAYNKLEQTLAEIAIILGALDNIYSDLDRVLNILTEAEVELE